MCYSFLQALDGPRTVVLTSPSWKLDLQNQGPEAHGMSKGEEPASGLKSWEMIEWRPRT